MFLCFEGVEKLLHSYVHSDDDAHRAKLAAALADPNTDLRALEAQKIKGAIRTDFVLSAEIVAITLGIVADSAFGTQLAVLTGIALLMTVGVYGLVGGIVKLDDAGLYLSRLEGQGTWLGFQRAFGRGILRMAPHLMKTLSVVGMIAMFLVGGGILVHGIPALHHGIEHLAELGHALPAAATLVPILAHGLIGVVAGAVVLAVVTVAQRVRKAL